MSQNVQNANVGLKKVKMVMKFTGEKLLAEKRLLVTKSICLHIKKCLKYTIFYIINCLHHALIVWMNNGY